MEHKNISATRRNYLNDNNKRLILNTIRQKEFVSRSEISKITRIRPGTVNNFVAELIGEHYIKEIGQGESSGGRRPVLLSINEDTDGKLIIGIQLLEFSIVGVVVNLNGKIVGKIEKKNGASAGKGNLIKETLKTVSSLFREYIDAGQKERVLGIGLAVPGLVDRDKGISLYASYHSWWKNIPFGEIISAEFRLPPYLENDTRALTLAEKWFGRGQGIDNFLYIDVGEGIGLGIVLNGNLYRGAGEMAGEFGHTTVDESGPLCSCGNHGCLEVMSSTLALEGEARRLLARGVKSTLRERLKGNIEHLTYSDVLEEVHRGDKVALRTMDGVGKYLSIAIANVVNLFNPSLVIIGGVMAQAGDLILEPVRRAVKLRSLPALANEVEICLNQLNKYSGAQGAATLVLRKIFVSGTE